MTQPKGTTFIQRLGFDDKDLTSPKHDELMIWFDKWIDKNLNELVKITKFFYVEKNEWIDLSWFGSQFDVSQLKYAPVVPSKKRQEWPIMNGKYTNGFADMRVEYSRPYLSFSESSRELKFKYTDSVMYFEIKPQIPSMGELLRQINFYKAYTGSAKWFVVSPDTRFKSAIESQDIGFIEVGKELREVEEMGL